MLESGTTGKYGNDNSTKATLQTGMTFIAMGGSKPRAIQPERQSVKVSFWSRVLTLIAVLVPIFGILSAAKILWGTDLHSIDLYVAGAFYILTGLGITIGYHRLFAHRSFEAHPVVRVVLAILGAMTLQGPLTQWVTDHRIHHMHSDKKGDPHSPNLAGDSFFGMLKGLLHAHVGWMFTEKGFYRTSKYATDIYEDKYLLKVDKLYLLWVTLSLALPFALGYGFGGTVELGLEMFVWAGLVRIFLFQHSTFAVNSICHKFGRRRYKTKDNSRNQFLVALLTFGEGWHNNHHAFPRSARHGLGKLQIDFSWVLIVVMQKLKLASNISLPSGDQAVKSALRKK
jgi:stearoyl-CoA desaturase (delta-9 desaturase)